MKERKIRAASRAMCCNVLCVAVYCSVLECVAVCWSVLRCVAVCCSVLQCVAANEYSLKTAKYEQQIGIFICCLS
jgi:hypothetical protein